MNETATNEDTDFDPTAECHFPDCDSDSLPGSEFCIGHDPEDHI